MIIDGHAHISETDYGNLDIYLQQLKEAGIEQAVVVPGGMMDVRKMTEYIMGRGQPESLIPDNAYVAKALKEHGDTLTGFICLDPHEKEASAKLENALNNGIRGLKLSPITHQFSFASGAVAELAECCGNYGFPVYSHVLYNPGASTAKFVALARRFPKTNFILGHMGFGPADLEALEAAVKLDNFFLETSIGSFLHIKEAVAKAGPNKIIFGSEFPLSHPKLELERILLLNLKENAQEKIVCENIKELLGLSCQRGK